jgi:hypothetical protein
MPGALFERVVDSLADRGSFALIPRRLEEIYPILLSDAQFLEALHGVVATSVIHENEPDLRFIQELSKLCDG